MKNLFVLLVVIISLSSCGETIENHELYEKSEIIEARLYNLNVAIDDDGEVHYNAFEENGEYISETDCNIDWTINLKKEDIEFPVIRRTYHTFIYSELFKGDRIYTSVSIPTIVLPLNYKLEYIVD